MESRMLVPKISVILKKTLIIITLFLGINSLTAQDVLIYSLDPGDLTTNETFWDVWSIPAGATISSWKRIATGDRPCGYGGAIPRNAWGSNWDTKQGYHIYAAGINPNCDYNGYIRYRNNMMATAKFYIGWAVANYNSSLEEADFLEFTLTVDYGIPSINSSDYFKIVNMYGPYSEELFSTNQATGAYEDTYNVITKTFTIQPYQNVHCIDFRFETNYGFLNTAKEGPYISRVTLTGKLKPKITATPVTNSFGNVEVGTCGADQAFEIRNIGGGTATGSVSLTGTNANQFSISGGGAYSLTANQTKIINVKFCPTNSGNQSAVLNVTGTNTNSVTSSLTGNGITFSTSATSISIGSGTGTTGSITVSSNTSWTANDDASWLSFSPTSGTGNATVTVTSTSANLAVDPRSATLTFSPAGGSSKTVTVTQSGATRVLNVSPTNQSVAAASGTTPFTVTSNIQWTASSNQAWCTVTPSGTGNGTLTASFTANTSTSSRSATITVSGTGVSNRTVTVNQAGAASVLTVTPSNQNVTAASGTTTFNVTSNIAWGASSNQTWCTVTPSGTGNGTITATFTANTVIASRTATITVSGTGASNQTLTVTQAGASPSVTMSPSNQNVTAASGTTTFSVTSNISWTASSNQTWCTVTPSGTGNGTLTATYSANTASTSRTATITVSGSGVSNQTVSVMQAGTGPTLIVSPANQNVTASSGTTSFTVSSNISWTASSNQTWCTITPSGTGNGTITATCSANTASASRTATITVSGTGVSNQIVTVTQAGATASTLSITPSSRSVTATSGTTTFSVTSDISWTASSNQTWCTVTPSGTGNGTITATYTANTASASRTATITISGSGVSNQTVTVIQFGTAPTLSLSPANQNLTSASGNTSFSVTSNISWTATSNQTWCTITPSGSGNGTITVTYTANTVSASRTATITVAGTGVSNQTVTVTQSGTSPSTLSITPLSRSVTATSVTTTFSVTSNISWSASSSQSWCTVTPSGIANGTITATYGANTTQSPRTATITVSGPGISDQSVTLTQSAMSPTLSISPSFRNVTQSSGTTTFSVTSNVSWAASSDQTWCTVTPSGNGTGTLTATFTDNTSNEPRIATITVSGPEVNDRSLRVIQPFTDTYCSSGSYNCDEYISNVTFGTINNNSGCNKYGNYISLSSDIAPGANFTIAVTNGNPHSTSRCGIWIDWNNDGNFIDEFPITVYGSPGGGPYSATVTCPEGTLTGAKRVRIKILHNESPTPCGFSTLGEVEDYTINVIECNLTPPAIGTITHPTCNLSTGSVVLNNLPSTGTWTLTRTPGSSTINGTGTTVTITGVASGTYQYSVKNYAGCTSGVSGNVVINVQPKKPATPTIESVIQPTCIKKTGSVTIKNLPSTGSWVLSGITGDLSVNGTGVSTVLSDLASGTFSFKVTNDAGCSSPNTTSVVINVPETGTIPVIKSKWNDILICTNGSNSITSYKWYLNNTLIPGATGRWYETKKQSGTYMVETVDRQGCVNSSNTISVAAGKAITVYPNPASNSFGIDLKNINGRRATVSMFNSNGIMVKEFQTGEVFDGTIKEIPVENLSEGSYLIRVRVDDELYYTKILIVK